MIRCPSIVKTLDECTVVVQEAGPSLTGIRDPLMRFMNCSVAGRNRDGVSPPGNLTLKLDERTVDFPLPVAPMTLLKIDDR